ncbi:MAG: Na/Pi symporter [Opitutales bacterium]|jgi:sodium-dependent phosphate cotransporter
MPSLAQLPKPVILWLKIAALMFCLYMFIVGVSGMGEAFNMFGAGFANRMLAATKNPFAALMMGLLATSIVQSSSATTSIVVGMVAGGVLPLEAAIPMVMGSSIGTTITAVMVSFGSVQRPAEFERSLSTALLHLLFNVMAVAIIFPMEMATGFLTHTAEIGQSLFSNVGGMKLCNPLKIATSPMIGLLKFVAFHNAILFLIGTLALTFATLIWLVKLLRILVMTKVEAFFDQVLFRSWQRAMTFGFLLTLVLQTSSVTTSLTIPLAGAGVLKLIQIFPFILGSNVGTTITAFLAAMATGQKLPMVVAFAHIAFNILGILLIWPIPAVRRLPLIAAQAIARRSAHARYIPVALIAFVYFIIPLTLVIVLS